MKNSFREYLLKGEELPTTAWYERHLLKVGNLYVSFENEKIELTRDKECAVEFKSEHDAFAFSMRYYVEIIEHRKNDNYDNILIVKK